MLMNLLKTVHKTLLNVLIFYLFSCISFFFSSKEIFCQPPGKIKNGKHTNSWRDIFEYNELVTYSCDPSNGPEEYSLVGDSKLICSGPSTWSTDPPECKGNSISISFFLSL